MSDGSIHHNDEQEISQVLGEALYGYSEEGLPQWGDHVAVTLAIEAGRRLKQLTGILRKIANATTPGESYPAPVHGWAESAVLEYPAPADDEADAQRYRALRNHTQMLDPRMDGTSLYRVRGITGRFHNFDEAADELIKRARAGVPRRRDPFAQDQP